jgi:hypothetical protein
VHGYELDVLRERLRREAVRLQRKSDATLIAPVATIERLSRAGTVARRRLLLIAGEGAALMLAFAAFAAATRRRDIDLATEQLQTLGGSRGQGVALRAIEAAVPTAFGIVLAMAVLRAGLEPIRVQDNLPRAFVNAALPAQTLGAVVALILVGGCLLVAVTGRRRTRLGLGALELAALTALGVVVWQTATTSALDPEQIAGGNGGGPILLLLPSLSAFAAGVLFLRILAPLFRLGERLARGRSVAVRLALLSAARNPNQVAAATTFLAVAVGSALFSLSYRATLDRQSQEAAWFEAGGRVRVIERGGFGAPDVSPLSRYSLVADERPTPVLRFPAVLRETGRLAEPPVTVVGLPSDAVARLPGWREDFSALSAGDIATRLGRRTSLLAGPVLPSKPQSLRMWVRGQIQVSRAIELAFLLPGARFEWLRLGSVGGRWRLMSATIPKRFRGARLVGIRFPPSETSPGMGALNEGSIDLGQLETRTEMGWRKVTAFESWTTPPSPGQRGSVFSHLVFTGPVDRATQYLIAGGTTPFIRPRSGLPTELPALASPAVAAVSVDGLVTLEVLGQELRVRAVATSRFFPTVVDAPDRFVVLDYNRLFTALNLEHPGLAPPSEAWFFQVPATDFRARLAAPPFKTERVIDAVALEHRLRSDPLARGTELVLVAAGVAGAVLALIALLLATRAVLMSERQLLAEYEALGVPPSTLSRSLQLRVVFAATLGLLASIVGSLLALQLTAAFVVITAGASRPLPPIQPHVATLAGAALLVAVAAATVAAAARQSAVYLRQPTGARLRG